MGHEMTTSERQFKSMPFQTDPSFAVRANRVVFSILLIALVAWPSIGEETYRTWTSAGGARVSATFVELNRDTVVSKKENGKAVRILLSQIIEEDRELVFQLVGKAGPTRFRSSPVRRRYNCRRLPMDSNIQSYEIHGPWRARSIFISMKKSGVHVSHILGKPGKSPWQGYEYQFMWADSKTELGPVCIQVK
jgi:hypothetical protein